MHLTWPGLDIDTWEQAQPSIDPDVVHWFRSWPTTNQWQQVLGETARALDLDYVQAMSGAGHDAQEIAAICPMAMIFVAGEYGGISHTPREYSNPDACANRTTLLANAIRRLADEPA